MARSAHRYARVSIDLWYRFPPSRDGYARVESRVELSWMTLYTPASCSHECMNEASGGKLAARVKEELETLRKCEILLDQVYRCIYAYR